MSGQDWNWMERAERVEGTGFLTWFLLGEDDGGYLCTRRNLTDWRVASKWNPHGWVAYTFSRMTGKLVWLESY